MVALLDHLLRDGSSDAQSVCVPSARPGYIRFMFLPSTGFRCGTTLANDGMLMSGTMMTVPESWLRIDARGCKASQRQDRGILRPVRARDLARARVLAARRGRRSTGIDSAASLPAATSMAPVAVCPRCCRRRADRERRLRRSEHRVPAQRQRHHPSCHHACIRHGALHGAAWNTGRGQDDDCAHRLIGTSRFSSSNQCLTTTTVGGSPAPVSSRIIRNRCPSGATS